MKRPSFSTTFDIGGTC